MIKFQDLKNGDFVMADFEGNLREGEVIQLMPAEKEVFVRTDVQDFCFKPEQLHPIPLDEEQLLRLNFQRMEMENGAVKYLKGPFRILLTTPGNFSKMEIWYREDRRHIHQAISVHELQNHYFSMTKVHLTKEPV